MYIYLRVFLGGGSRLLLGSRLHNDHAHEGSHDCYGKHKEHCRDGNSIVAVREEALQRVMRVQKWLRVKSSLLSC